MEQLSLVIDFDYRASSRAHTLGAAGLSNNYTYRATQIAGG